MAPGPKDKRYLEMACGVAMTSTSRMKHGALIVKHSKVLGLSPNVNKNSPQFVGQQYASVHAEVRAMQRAGWPTKAICYVARVNNFGEKRLSRPCASCQKMLDTFRVRAIYTV